MNLYPTEPEYILEQPLEKTHRSSAQLKAIESTSLEQIAEKLERLLLLGVMSTTLLKEIQEESAMLARLWLD